MIQRLKYELMPLIKEYINEGYIRASKDIFENYFYERTGTLLYE
jgi:5-methylcytosine-specific restriction protein B